MISLFDYMKSKGLISDHIIYGNKIANFSGSKIIDLAHELAYKTEIKPKTDKITTFSHCASISLGGGRAECAVVNCRRQRLESLARFAAFYSDKVYIRNFFSDYLHLREINEDDLKRRFFDDIYLTAYMKPLLKKGIVRFISETSQLCPNCLGTAMGLGPKSGKRFRKLWSKLGQDFFDNTSFSLDRLQGRIAIRMSGPKRYFEHGGLLLLVRELPPSIRSRPSIAKRYEKKGSIKISKTLSKELKIHEDLAREAIHNIAYHLLVNKSLNTSFLTDKQLHIDFLKYATDNRDIEERNIVAYKHLTSLVPFVGDVDLKNIVKLKEREQESFIQVRSRLNEIILEFMNTKSNFNEQTAKMAYSDVIAPELAKLERRVKNAKKDLISTASRSFIGMVGAISIGLFSGLIPAEVANIAQAVGVASFGSDMIKKIMALGDKRKSIQDEDLYFLWRVNIFRKRPNKPVEAGGENQRGITIR